MKPSVSSIGHFDWLLYAGYTLASVTGLLVIKLYLPALKDLGQGGSLFRKEVLFVGAGAGLYITSFLLWLVILSRIELSVAYPVAIGLTLVGSTLVAAAVLGEHISMLRLFGVFVVFAGILLVTRS